MWLKKKDGRVSWKDLAYGRGFCKLRKGTVLYDSGRENPNTSGWGNHR